MSDSDHAVLLLASRGRTYEERRGRVKGILELLERTPLHDRARLPGADPRTDAEVGDGDDGDLNKADGADGPGEADARQQLADHAREDETAGCGAAGGDTDGEGAAAVKIGGENGECRAE